MIYANIDKHESDPVSLPVYDVAIGVAAVAACALPWIHIFHYIDQPGYRLRELCDAFGITGIGAQPARPDLHTAWMWVGWFALHCPILAAFAGAAAALSRSRLLQLVTGGLLLVPVLWMPLFTRELSTSLFKVGYWVGAVSAVLLVLRSFRDEH